MARHLLVTNDYPPKTGGIQVYLHELWSRLEPDRAVVMTASSHDDPAWPLGLLGPRLSRPYGVVLHGAEVAIPGRLPLVASSLRYVLRHARVAICAGTYPEAEARRIAAEWMPPVIQVPPGVDANRFEPVENARRDEVRHQLGLDPSATLVSSYSRLVPRKGMDTLIKASASLTSRFPHLQVAIGGAGRDRARLEKLAQRLKAPVVFLGRVSDVDLPEWLGASDLMVMACRSRWFGLEQEGFGIVFVEAGAAGLAQVAGRSGGSHEAVRHGVTGLVVERPDQSGALADAMAQLLEDEVLRAQFGRDARDLTRSDFDWQVLSSRLSAGLTPYDSSGPRRPV